MWRLAERSSELATEVRGRKVRGPGERRHVEWLAVARVDQVLGAQQVARRRQEHHSISLDARRAYPLGMEPARARELLRAERERIEVALGRLAHEDDSEPVDEYDPANLASDLYQDELDEGLRVGLREQLDAVKRAEQRLAAGTYGLSIESGERIPDDRLEAVPTAERTIDEERARRSL